MLLNKVASFCLFQSYQVDREMKLQNKKNKKIDPWCLQFAMLCLSELPIWSGYRYEYKENLNFDGLTNEKKR